MSRPAQPGYSPGDLMDLADRTQGEARVAVAGGFVGVALPDWPGLAACAILPVEQARKLAAQLLLAADEHDAIVDAALIREGVR